MLGEKKPGFVFANTHHIRERSVEVREFPSFLSLPLSLSLSLSLTISVRDR